jgi:glutamyl-tRNA(Gln) amidotransferase subunit E
MLKKAVGAKEDDTIVTVWGPKQDADTGASEIIIRAREATIGIPSETRQALRDGTNGFERILPGPNRMYPDTDLPPRRITQEQLGRIKKGVPRPFWESERWYRELGIPADVVAPLSISPFAGLFETAVKEWRIPPTLAGVTLIQFPKRVAKKLGRSVDFSVEMMREILLAYRDRALAKEGILPALMQVAAGQGFSRHSLPGLCSDRELSEAIERSESELSAMELHNPEKESDVLMGLVMNKVRGRIDGKVVAANFAGTPAERRS